jgi:hypothetical protein
MNKLEILIQGRIEDLKLATQCQTWKHLAYIVISQERDDYCWTKAMEFMDQGTAVREFSRELVGQKFADRKGIDDAVLFDPRVTLALVLWSNEHTKAKESKERWLECADLRLKEVA